MITIPKRDVRFKSLRSYFDDRVVLHLKTVVWEVSEFLVGSPPGPLWERLLKSKSHQEERETIKSKDTRDLKLFS